MSKKDKVEIVPHHFEKVCYFCNGLGYTTEKIQGIKNQKGTFYCTETCLRCEGTGIYIQTFYHLIYKGQCFGVDTVK